VRLMVERAGSRRRDVWIVAAGVVACLWVSACQPGGVRDAEDAEPTGVVVAWVDDEGIGLDEVLAIRPARGDEDREARIETAVLGKIANREARRRMLDEQPDVERALSNVRVQAMRREDQILREALKKELAKDVEISEEELRQAYQENERSYRDRQLRLREWSFATQREAQDAVEGVAGADALDPGEAVEPDPVSLRNPPAIYARVMGRLRHPGDRVVVEAKGKWLVLELVDFVTDARIPYEEVRDHVLRRLRRERAEEVFQERLRELRASADVRLDQAVVSDDELWQERRSPR
jgi:hypothetical protein